MQYVRSHAKSATTPSIEKAIMAALLKLIKANAPFAWTDELTRLVQQAGQLHCNYIVFLNSYVSVGHQKVVDRYKPLHVHRATRSMGDAMDVDEDIVFAASKVGNGGRGVDVRGLLLQGMPPVIQITPTVQQQIQRAPASPSRPLDSR